MHGVNRSLFYLLLSSLAVCAFVPPSEKLAREHHIGRQILSPPSTTVASRTDTATVTSTSTTVTSASSTTSALSSTTSSSDSITTTSSAPPQTTQGPSTSIGITTDSGGHIGTSVTVITPSLTSATPTQSAASEEGSGGLGTGSIIGLSVAGGIAVLGIVGFFVWKLTRKRFSDFDDNEAIKWPELNAHGGDTHALPVHNTGRAGFDTGSEPDANPIVPDPYAVPPLPHLNPNQPYRDDPSAPGYYDPYRGPIPNTFNDTESVDVPTGPGWSNAEAIRMTQMSRARSPGPQAAYDAGAVGRQSPGPQVAYGQGGYVDDRVRSPGPNVGLGGTPGRRSPGPQAAYDPTSIPR